MNHRAIARPLLVLGTGLILAAVLASTANAQYFGRNKIQYENFDWQILNTPHFEIFFYPEEEELAARTAVIVEDAYQRMSRIFDHEFSRRIPFILYASPNDFQQTNISDGFIGEGTGGFSEPMRNRMVLPYPGDNEGFIHVINHELVHVFMFDIVYGSTKSGGARSRWFPVPLWFAEGMAEWFSSGWDEQADMWMRDATIYDWVIPLPQIRGGFQVYKEGQSAMRYVADTYGDQKVVELFKALGRTHDVDRALDSTIGLDTEELSERWVKWLKQSYWGLYGDKQEPEDLGRRVTDHWEERNYFYQQPSISPDGRYVAFFSDFDGLVDLYLMDAIEGTVIRKLVTGYRSNRFLTLHSFESSIGFSPDSESVAFVAKSGRDEQLYVVDVQSGEVEHSIPLSMDVARSPSWSPTDDRVVLSGTRGGQTDLYLVDLESRSIEALTDDIIDEHSPAWYPDGRHVIYSARLPSTADLRFEEDETGVLRLRQKVLDEPQMLEVATGYDLFRLDTETGDHEVAVATPGADEDPFVVDEETVVFISDWSGVSNLYAYDRTTDEVMRLSDVLGGVFHPSVSPAADRLVFTGFNQAGFDIFIRENFRDLLQEADYPRVVDTPVSMVPVPGQGEARPERSAGGESPPMDVAELDPDRLPPAARAWPADDPRPATASAESEAGEDPADEPEPTAGNGDVDALVDAAVAASDSAGTDDQAIGSVEPYRLRFSLDPYGGSGSGGVFYSEGLGFGAAQRISLSDLLGNHRMSFLVNFYGSFENSDLAASYTYLKRRVNLSGGVFHYRNILNSNFTSLGEVFDDNRLFTERNYGVFGLASYPFTQFDRLDFELQAYVSEREFFEYDRVRRAYFRVGDEQRDTLVQPSLTFVHDSTFYGQTGPVTGSRWQLSFSPAIPVGGEEGVDRTTTYLDYRRYFRLWDRNSIAFRFLGAQSVGGQPRNFVIGGPFTLRGWDLFDFEEVDENGDPRNPNLLGSKLLMMNLEYRFPFVDALILGWPGRWGIGGISGAVFLDAGSAFDDDIRFFSHTENGALRLEDLNADFGFGIRINIGWIPLKFDWAWRTDLAETSDDPQFSFSIGPSF